MGKTMKKMVQIGDITINVVRDELLNVHRVFSTESPHTTLITYEDAKWTIDNNYYNELTDAIDIAIWCAYNDSLYARIRRKAMINPNLRAKVKTMDFETFQRNYLTSGQKHGIIHT